MATITITFGDQAENHVGMQKLGKLANEGFTVKELENISENIKDEICQEYIRLDDMSDNKEPAAILIIRDGVKLFGLDKDELLEEQKNLEWDKKAYMYGRVVNKKARYNICYDDKEQEADYGNKKGKIVAWGDVPLLKKMKEGLLDIFGDKTKDLKAEGNYYYDVKNCGIGFHGDSERKIVIGVRLGETLPLHYQWYYKGEEVGNRLKFELNNGDIYLMSEKATGNNWKKKNIYTLRHAAGCDKYLYPKK